VCKSKAKESLTNRRMKLQGKLAPSPEILYYAVDGNILFLDVIL
jgi:hypothetical protein